MSEYFSDKHPITNQRRRVPSDGVAYSCACLAIVRGLRAWTEHKEICEAHKRQVQRIKTVVRLGVK